MWGRIQILSCLSECSVNVHYYEYFSAMFLCETGNSCTKLHSYPIYIILNTTIDQSINANYQCQNLITLYVCGNIHYRGCTKWKKTAYFYLQLHSHIVALGCFHQLFIHTKQLVSDKTLTCISQRAKYKLQSPFSP